MSNYLNIPFLSPFKWVPHTLTPGIHFDANWAYQQIKSWELKRGYYQKWKRSITTKIQITATIPPDDVKVYDINQQLIKTFVWTIAGVGVGNEKCYETTVDFTDVANDGVYFMYQKNTLLSVNFEAITEPILLKDNHSNLLLFSYKNSFNAHGMVWTTNIEQHFMCEAAVCDFNPDGDRNTFVDQVHNVKTLSGFPFRTFKLEVGEAPGVAPWVIDLLNRIFYCDRVILGEPGGPVGIQYERPEGSKWDISRIRGYPLIGGRTDILPAQNVDSLQFIDVDPIAPGIIVAYNLDQGLFGTTTNIVHITDFEQT